MKTRHITSKQSKLLMFALLILPAVGFAQEQEVATVSYFSNALFNTLLVTIILLAILVVALSSVLKNISNSDLLMRNIKSDKNSGNSNAAKTTMLLLLFTLSGFSLFSQTTNPVVADDGRIGGVDQFTFYFMLSTIFLELIVITVLINTIRYVLKTDEKLSPVATNKPKEKTILDVLSDAVEVENEESILLDHDYDGIKELDNNLPPWWKYGFYLTIVIGVIYLINYHVIKTSPLQGEEYTISVKKAEAEVAEYMKNSANNVDESTVKMLDNSADLAAGKDLFLNNCAACHGKLGEGTVGPNLTDDYWLHSGGVKDIFKTIKYGYPDKGMKSWKEDFSPMQIAQLTSYIRTLKGTNPPKAKDKQGELYVEEGTAVSDSTAVIADSSKLSAISDTLKK